MFGSTTLDIVTGLLFIYLLYSLLATTLNETIASFIGLRALIFKKGVIRMLDDDSKGKFANNFLNHPLIKFLGNKNKLWGAISRGPSYITAQKFSAVLIDLIGRIDDSKAPTPDLDNRTLDEQAIDSKINSELGNHTKHKVIIQKETLQGIHTIWLASDRKMEAFKKGLEDWFNDSMERVSGWYKRMTQAFLLIIGLCIAIGFNVDSIQIVKKLSVDKDARTNLVNMAIEFDKSHKNDSALLGKAASLNKDSATDALSLYKTNMKKFTGVNDTLNKQIKQTQSLLGQGWDFPHPDNCFLSNLWYGFHQCRSPWSKAMGFFITALAISLGAPFWFDLLQKVISLRGTGDTPEETDKKKAALKKANK